MEKAMKIAVAGTDYVGLASALCLAELRNDGSADLDPVFVVGCDILDLAIVTAAE
jgi:UDP-glucose 6-dehydrogenase